MALQVITSNLKPWMSRAGQLRIIAGLAVSAGMLAGLGISQPAEASPRTTQPAYLLGEETADMRALRTRLTQVYEQHRPPGMQVAVISDGRKAAFGFGSIDREASTAVRPEHVFRFGSITKLLVASAFLQRLEAQKGDVQGLVASAFPDRKLPAGLTYQRLLNHTSGLPDILDSKRFGAELEAHPLRVWTPEELWAIAADVPIRSEPWRYANTNYNLIGEVLQATPGSSWQQATIQAIGVPFLTVPAHPQPPGVARGYDRACLIVRCFWRPATAYDASVFFAAGALAGTASNLADAGDRIFRGAMLSPSSRKALLSFVDVTLKPYSELMTGYGLGVMRFQAGGVEIWGHTGDVPGFAAILLHRPDKGLTAVVLMNGAFGSTSVYRDIIQAVSQRRVP
jgi:D-alanyl-D-alanine carboxypeptidase